MAKPRIELAVDEARKIIAAEQIIKTPVPIEKICRAREVTIQYGPLDDDLSGMAFIKNGMQVIGVNNLHHPNRQRFTVGHELGHLTLHRSLIESEIHLDRGSLKRDLLSSMGIDPIEIEANTFAAELLMPKLLLEDALLGKTVDLEDDKVISELARKFRVSDAAMRFRLDASWK